MSFRFLSAPFADPHAYFSAADSSAGAPVSPLRYTFIWFSARAQTVVSRVSMRTSLLARAPLLLFFKAGWKSLVFPTL